MLFRITGWNIFIFSVLRNSRRRENYFFWYNVDASTCFVALMEFCSGGVWCLSLRLCMCMCVCVLVKVIERKKKLVKTFFNMFFYKR